MDYRVRFVAYSTATWIAVVVVGTELTPPDVYTQLAVLVAAFLLSPVVAHLLVFGFAPPSRKP